MTKRIILIIGCMFSLHAYSQSKYIESQKSQLIDQEQLSYGYLPKQSTTEHTDKQPFAGKAEIENFLFQINRQKGATSDMTPEISSWLTQNLMSYGNDATIIFIRHPLILSKLFDTSYTAISKEFTAVCGKQTDVSNELKLFDKDYQKIKEKYKSNVNDIDTLTTSGKKLTKAQLKKIAEKEKENEDLVTQMGKLSILIENYKKKVDSYDTELSVIQKKFTDAKNFLVEDTTQVLTTVLSKENYQYSDYILNKKNIMIITFGNFKNYQLQFTNGKKRYQQEASDLGILAKAITGIDLSELSKEGGGSCTPKGDDTKPSSLPLNFVLLKRAEIDPPSAVEMVTPKGEKKILSEIHEKSYVGIKVGVSLANVENKFFNLNTNNELTIQSDSLNSTDLKANLMALIELYPFGRDYDRLKPITAANNIPFYERIGIVGGVKISKDPLEAIFTGASLAISKEFNVVAGISFIQIAKDVKVLEVGYNKTIEYLRDHADKEYKPTFYFGFSLSPGQLLKSLGISK